MDPDEAERNLRNFMDKIGHPQPFGQYLLQLIDEKDMKDSDVYKNANIDRRLFSKIRSNPHYRPGKDKVMALCVGLGLNETEAAQLLARAGYAFSDSSRQDWAVRWYLQHGDTQVWVLDGLLAELHLPTLTCGA